MASDELGRLHDAFAAQVQAALASAAGSDRHPTARRAEAAYAAGLEARLAALEAEREATLRRLDAEIVRQREAIDRLAAQRQPGGEGAGGAGDGAAKRSGGAAPNRARPGGTKPARPAGGRKRPR